MVRLNQTNISSWNSDKIDSINNNSIDKGIKYKVNKILSIYKSISNFDEYSILSHHLRNIVKENNASVYSALIWRIENTNNKRRLIQAVVSNDRTGDSLSVIKNSFY
jgi:hypothetical protein